MNCVTFESRDITLVDALDRVLHKGVVLDGELILSVADVDLIFIGVKVMLASVSTAERLKWMGKRQGMHDSSGDTLLFPENTSSEAYSSGERPRNPTACSTPSLNESDAVVSSGDGNDQKRVEHGLAKLALTLIEVIRRLMEKQAIRRMEEGSLTDDEVERLGLTLMRLKGKMEELKDIFGLKDGDLNLNLGPLGDLV